MRDSCLDCLAWGVTRRHGWRCQACESWRDRFPISSDCPSCRRHVPVNARGYCRLCAARPLWSDRAMPPTTSRRPTVTANSCSSSTCSGKAATPAVLTVRPSPWPVHYPVAHEQLTLFDATRDLNAARLRGFALPPLPDLAAALDQAVDEHAAAHGWGDGLTAGVHQAMHVLLTIQDTPGSVIKHSEAQTLVQMPCTGVLPVLEVLAATGMFTDDRPPPLDPWFSAHTDQLPEPMLSELREWFHVLRDGSTVTPRRRPRKPSTARLYVWLVTPALRAWADAGYSRCARSPDKMCSTCCPPSTNPLLQHSQRAEPPVRFAQAHTTSRSSTR